MIGHESLISSRVNSRVFEGRVRVESGVSKNATRVRLEYESLTRVPISVLKHGLSSSAQILMYWFWLLRIMRSSAKTLLYAWYQVHWRLSQSGMRWDETRQQHYRYSMHLLEQTLLEDSLE